jgi:S1-C subfamily serine protease
MGRLGTMVCITALGVALPGCGGSAGGATPRMSAQDRLDFSVVGVETRIGGDRVLGSGFVIDGARGLVLTAADTVWGARSIKLATGLGVLHGRIVARAPCDDLAVLELYPRIPGLAPLPAAPADGGAAGRLLRSLGRRRGDARSEGDAVASIPVRTASPLPSSGGIQLDSPLVPEGPGGPVIDPAGRLVGMARASEATRAVTVPWGRIRPRLDQLRPGPRRVFAGWADQYRCAGRLDAAARARHPRYRLSDARLNVPIPPTRVPGAEGIDG